MRLPSTPQSQDLSPAGCICCIFCQKANLDKLLKKKTFTSAKPEPCSVALCPFSSDKGNFGHCSASPLLLEHIPARGDFTSCQIEINKILYYQGKKIKNKLKELCGLQKSHEVLEATYRISFKWILNYSYWPGTNIWLLRRA